MSEAKGQQEPSMEEILASIRRIIAEDGDSVPTQPSEERASTSRQEEILELTEVVEEDGTVVSLKPGGVKSRAAEAPGEAAIEPKPSPAATPPVAPPRFETRLGEASPSRIAAAVPPLESEATQKPWLEAKAPETPVLTTPPEPVSETKAPDPPQAALAAPATAVREVPEVQPSASGERLVSSATAAASVAALSQLADFGQSGQVGTVPLGDAGRTLESLVRELLRPMLKDWLDANLAPLVERLVQDEIRRLAREAQNR